MVYDTFILGQISKDTNVDYDGAIQREFGGAVVHSGFAAANTGHKVAALEKSSSNDIKPDEVFAEVENITVFHVESQTSTEIKNEFLSADKERRTCTAISRIESYRISEIPDIKAHIYHIAGLMKGDLSEDIIEFSSLRAKVAVDVQGFVRCVENGKMAFHDWDKKQKCLPMITYFKTDVAESEIITGLEDKIEAAKMIHSWGTKEIMTTHNTEVIIYDGLRVYSQPIKARNLSGRSGRGDTTFSTYITERLTHSIEDSLLFAAATVSLKMETSGPFRKTRQDVEEYIKNFY